MKKYSEYKIDDYLSDPEYRNWVLSGGHTDTSHPWNQWFDQHPEQKKIARQARELLFACQVEEAPFPADYFDRIKIETLGAIGQRSSILKLWTWAAAAVIVLVCGFIGWKVVSDREASGPVAAVNVPDEVRNSGFLRYNHTQKIIPVALPDGSSVLLHPGSELSYRQIEGLNREVYLKGKAFFEVVKDPQNPFLVYSGEMITRVLGTSFTITAYTEDADFSVVVKTGKVTVSTRTEAQSGAGLNEKEVQLIPNEKLVFDRGKLEFKRLEINTKDILEYVPPTEISYTFEDAPVAAVFKEIGKAYRLKIEMDESLFKGCELTTNLTDEPLFEKLGIVCSAVGPGTSFVVEDGVIRVISKGCNQ